MTHQKQVPKEGMNATQSPPKPKLLDFDQTIRSEIQSLRVLAAYLLPDSETVDEIIQLTLIRAYEQWSELDAEREPGPWLRTILRYMVKTELKQRQRQAHNLKRYKDRWLCTLGESIEDSDLEDDCDIHDILAQCKEKLQPHAKSLIVQRYEENLSIENISKHQEKSCSWVTTTLSRIRRSLKTCIEQHKGVL